MAEIPDNRVIDPRLETVYSGYAASPRKQRAWSDSPGNRAAFVDVAQALQSIAGAEINGREAILDLGCGTGGWVKYLSTRVDSDRLYGVDAVGARLEVARRAAPRAHLVHGDARVLPFGDGMFALVLLFTLLGDMPSLADVRRVVNEAGRVLRSGGLLAIYEPRVSNPLNKETRTIRASDIGLPLDSKTVRLLPPLGRRLGPLAPWLYPALIRVPALRSHRLWWYRKPG